MAAITLNTAAVGRGSTVIRTGTAQATTGQTDWIASPPWAKYCYIEYSLTAVAGNTPLVDVSILKSLESTPFNDTGAITLSGAFTQITGAATLRISIGPNIVTDATTAATGASDAGIAGILPGVIGIKVLQDRTSADETYTYTVAVRFSA